MPILKFSKQGTEVILDKLHMEDITNDKRTSFLDRSAFLSNKFKIDNGVHMAKNDIFFKMAKLLNTSRVRIDAMLIRDSRGSIIIVPKRSYVFWNGHSVEPAEYSILKSDENKLPMIQNF